MLSAELDLDHLDGRHWRNWWSLLVPPRAYDRPRWVLAVIDGTPDKLIKIVRGGDGARGSIDPATAPLPGLDPAALERWARALGAAAAIVVDRRVLGELSAEVEAQMRWDQDAMAQALTVFRAVKRRAGHGVWTAPAILELLPAPAYEPIQRTFDLLIPDRSALVAYIIEDDHSRVHASIIATKHDGDIARAATHAAIADLVPEAALARDWRTGYKRVLAAVEDRFARPSLALFIERATALRVMTGPSDQLARELNAKAIVIDPAPTWLLGLLGGAAVAAMAGRAARGLASMLPQTARDRASAIAARAQTAMKGSGAHPFALLGFDPLELWSKLREFYRP